MCNNEIESKQVGNRIIVNYIFNYFNVDYRHLNQNTILYHLY